MVRIKPWGMKRLLQLYCLLFVLLNSGVVAAQSVSAPAAPGGRNVQIRLKGYPTAEEIGRLARQGIELGDYLGGYTYWAIVREGTSTSLRGSRVTEITPPSPEDKVERTLLTWELPPYIHRGVDLVAVAIRYAGNASPAIVA